MALYSLVPSFRPLLAPVPRLRFRTDTHRQTDRHTQTDRQTHTQDNYRNRRVFLSDVYTLFKMTCSTYTYCACANTMPLLTFVWLAWRTKGVLCFQGNYYFFFCWSRPGTISCAFQHNLVGL